jgi:hypothetical protein
LDFKDIAQRQRHNPPTPRITTMSEMGRCTTPPPSITKLPLIRLLPVPPEVEASYATIIDGILASSDLNTISAKAIRKGLQSKVSFDLSAQKVRYCAV